MPSNADANSSRIHPPRFWWLKRIALACVMGVGLLGGFRAVWGYRARACLQEEIERIRARGEPLYPSDYMETDISDPDSLTARLLAASDALALTPAERGIMRRLARLTKMTSKRRDTIAELTVRSAAARELVREARRQGILDRPLAVAGPNLPGRRALQGYLSRELPLARILTQAALHYHDAADTTEALTCLRDALWIGDHLGQYPFLNSQLWSQYTARWVVYYVEAMSPELFGIASPGAPAPARAIKPAVRAAAAEVIAALLDDELARRQFVAAVHTERTSELMRAEQVLNQTERNLNTSLLAVISPDVLGFADRPLFEPIYRFDAARMLQYLTAVSDAVAAPNWPGVQAELPELFRATSDMDLFTHPLLRRTNTNLEWHTQLHFRTLALRRMAAVGLAVWLFEAEHGDWPDRLEQLAPEYLPEVPPDPFAGPDRRIAYDPYVEPPILYSVGANGIDEEGKLPFDLSGPQHWLQADMPYFLNGDRPW
ncbi:MAG: hypothetical protein IH895_03420 [Planctomycetes bacterium]|nr:hypothetical protein [Planctomycetota bacterium]